MKKVKGIIFDMDGLLFDTESIYCDANLVVAEKYDLPFTEEIYARFIGISDEEVWAELHKMFADHGKETVQKFIDESWGMAHDRFKIGNVDLKPGVHELLAYLEEKEIPRVLASSNVRPVIEILLEHAGIRDKFSDIISAEDVKFAKPDPEIFVIAADRLGIAAADGLVLEDSKNGILAAEGAGVPVVMVPDIVPPTAEIKEKTEAVLPTLHEVINFLEA
ncbi:haloacid dehalogenase superfamily, subfamily IA, variant 3 with third motif having DD or ED/haloacid dehalogenase superfamily, subfamily IA, variant 1 with third motif having Dx(3-4)D or Dx(3-4)E [Enterococcus malodoratus]|uniref:HAD family hydrolase n=1 Tax=Enterococcus malodoratus TaxID=71451 RepID=UPI0008D58198|nr:HAD family phosphatase [Enterococcus malodoratus]SES87480.1 haloacid dehalogenase superfamily, subfamily IA, variant 3 with third motif having DD or ED/haloacid dehalogenase superfamily, subfamily IA, variant 1 with third motif having Dx(3-4)D or Dx(3-4)E [Enterococcus malodoratus]